MDEPVDLKKLAQEAAQTAYDPRAKRCWFFHQWTMWRPTQVELWTQSHSIASSYKVTETQQFKRCIRCGLTRKRDI